MEQAFERSSRLLIEITCPLSTVVNINDIICRKQKIIKIRTEHFDVKIYFMITMLECLIDRQPGKL